LSVLNALHREEFGLGQGTIHRIEAF